MAYYDALKAIWPSLTDNTTDAKLATLNGMTVAATDKQDIPFGDVIGYLALNGLLAPLKQFSASAYTGVATHDQALGVAQTLFIMFGTITALQTSDPTAYGVMKGMVASLVANNNMTQAQADGLIALANKPAIPWWKANGYTSPVGTGDLINAGGLT